MVFSCHISWVGCLFFLFFSSFLVNYLFRRRVVPASQSSNSSIGIVTVPLSVIHWIHCFSSCEELWCFKNGGWIIFELPQCRRGLRTRAGSPSPRDGGGLLLHRRERPLHPAAHENGGLWRWPDRPQSAPRRCRERDGDLTSSDQLVSVQIPSPEECRAKNPAPRSPPPPVSSPPHTHPPTHPPTHPFLI